MVTCTIYLFINEFTACTSMTNASLFPDEGSSMPFSSRVSLDALSDCWRLLAGNESYTHKKVYTIPGGNRNKRQTTFS